MNKLSSTVLLCGLSTLILAPQVFAQNSNFSDTRGNWAEQYISTLADRSIIGGFPDGSFKPSADITRAQFAAIAVRAFNLPPSNNNSSFTDVRSNYWASPAISAVSNSGLVTGFPDGTFRPEERITRAQALVILAKALGNKFSPNASKLERFSDRQAVPDWARESISKAASAGIIVNFPDARQISPNNLASRGEVAALTYQTLFRLGNSNLPPLSIGSIDSISTPPVASNLDIDRIETNTDSLSAGDELLVRAFGTDRVTARFTVEGLNQNRPITMSEVRNGVYEGRYTIRRNDRQGNGRLRVTFSQQGANSVNRDFNRAIAINSGNGNNNSSLVIDKIETNTNSLSAGDELLVRAFGTDRVTARYTVEGLNQNRPIAMSEVRNGVYEGRYTIRRNDRQGNGRLRVTFSQQGANSTTKDFNRAIAINSDNANNNNLTLQPKITNFNNNAAVNLPVTLLGETLANANIKVSVEALSSVLGIIETSQTILNTTVRANRQGIFRVEIPEANRLTSGTRYRVRMTATNPQNNQSQNSEIVLRQR